MKIYIYRYGSLCEPDIIDAFKHIGLEVYEENAEVYNKNMLPSQAASIASATLAKEKYAFAFTINFFPWLSDVCQLLNITYISLIVDSPVLELYSNAISNSVNRIFLFDKMLFNEFKQYNKEHIFHIPLAANTSRTDELISHASDSDKKNMPVTYPSLAQHIRKNVRSIMLYFPIMKEVLLMELSIRSLKYTVLTL